MAIEIKDWLPQEPQQGPPLPEWLGIYWPWYKPPAAKFKVSGLAVFPAEVQIGQPVTISCSVENMGTAAGDFTVRMRGDFEAEQTVTLEPGQSVSVSFEVVPDIPKTYQVSVDGLTGTFKAIGVPDIRVEDLVISPAEVVIGEKVTISCRATNYGTAGTKKIVCTVS